MNKTYQTQFAGRDLIVETGKLAQFANGSCLIRYGETVVLTTVTASTSPRDGVDFFPLSVDYEEKMYSVGKIPGGFIRREGRPSDKAVLTSRVIDRPIRPLFPKDLRNDVVVNNLVLSVDQDYSPEIVAMIGTSIAISISDVPWNGPLGGILIGLVDGKVVFNPTEAERDASTLNVTLAGTKTKISMIEAGANEVPDDVMLDALIQGHKVIQDICDFIEGIREDIGKPKFSYVSKEVPADMFDAVKKFGWDKMRVAVLSDDKSVRDGAVAVLTDEVKAYVAGINESWLPLVGEAVYKLEKKVVRDYLFREHRRVDGRSIDVIRPLSAEINILPRVHGSGLFQRGQTQVLTACTLAPMSSAQKLDGIDPEDEKRYIHHYNFPPYSVGEAKSARSPGRREIGHGALAERSLIPVLPAEDEFPYAIRLVSEILMSNGSTSQGSVCASTLALMDAGVPIKRPVAGISAGLIVNEENDDDFLVFMDIQGIEDFFGDMDFKVAGTTEGITSIQMDLKVDGLSYEIIRQAFEMTKKGRLQIINDVILPCIAAPHVELSRYAPKILQTQVPVDKIREVIGSGGKVINRIIAETGCQIDIEEDGRVYVAAADIEMGRKAIRIIEGIVNDPEPGQIFDGRVTRLMTFGAFVEFAPGKEGLVHISKMGWSRVDKVEDVVSEGDAVKVMVTEVDGQGRINLSMRDCTPRPEGAAAESEHRDRPGRPAPSGTGSFAPRGDDRRPNSGPRGDERRQRPNDRRPGSGFEPRGESRSSENRPNSDKPAEGGPQKHTRDF